MPKKRADSGAAKKKREVPPRESRKKILVDGLFESPDAPKPPTIAKKKRIVKKKKNLARKTKPAYRIMIKRALQGSRTGISVFAIYKHLEDNYPVSDTFHRYVRASLRQGVSDGLFKRVRFSYKLTAKGRARLTGGGTRKKKKKTVKKKKSSKKSDSATKKRKRPAKKKGDKKEKKKKPATGAAKKKKAVAPKKKRAEPKKKESGGEKGMEKELPKAAAGKKLHVSPAGHKFRWQYQDGAWKDYEANGSDIVEDAYQHYVKNPGMCDVRAVKSGQWQYQVDFLNLKQTNIQHENHTTRAIRRLPLNE